MNPRIVYSAPHLFQVELIKDLLESSGIACTVKNQYLTGAAGELPPHECWPQLMVVDIDDIESAKKIVDQFLQQQSETSSQQWVCSECGERIEAQFKQCWKCGNFA